MVEEGYEVPVADPPVPTIDKDTMRIAGRRDHRLREWSIYPGDALPVVPAKLVKRIARGDYIDMTDLLKDNMEVLRRRRLEGEASSSHFDQPPSRREIPDIMSWVQAFSLYAAVVGTHHPEKTKEL